MKIHGVTNTIDHNQLMWWNGKEIIPYEKETHKTKKQNCPGFKAIKTKENTK